MKNMMIGLFVLGNIFSANASMLEINGPLDQKFFNAEINEGKSYFEVLGDMHKAGTVPSLTKLVNKAWSGRCFKYNNKDVPFNGGVVFRTIKSDAGPLSRDQVQLFNYDLADKKPANFFDDKTYSQIISADFWNSLNIGYNLKQSDIEKAFSDVTAESSAIIAKYLTNVTSSIKLSDKYLVDELSKNDAPSGIPRVVQRCYYFIPGYDN